MATTRTVRRFDSLGEPLLHVYRRESDGALLAEGYARREGLLEYRNADGSKRIELVSRKAVEDTADTIARATLTLHHPPGGFITPENYQDYAVGDVDGLVGIQERETQGGFARVRVAIRRADAIAEFAEGKTVELSSGYDVELDETPGVHEVFGRYDAIQTGCVVNHLALVPQGRAGHEVRLRADSLDAVAVRRITPGGDSPRDPRNDTMKPLLVLAGLLGLSLRADAADNDLVASIDGAVRKMKADMDVMGEQLAAAKQGDEDLAAVLSSMGVADITELKAKWTEMQAALQALTGERDALKAKVAEYEAAAGAAAAKVEGDRVDALAKFAGVKVDGLDLAAKRVAVAKSRIDSIDAQTPAPYLDGVLGSIEADMKRAQKRGDASEPGSSGARFDDWAVNVDADAASKPEKGKRDRFFNPHLDAADAAFGGAK